MNMNKIKATNMLDALIRQREDFEAIAQDETTNDTKEYAGLMTVEDMVERQVHLYLANSFLSEAIEHLTAALDVWPDLPPVYADNVVRAVKAVLGGQNAETQP